MNKIDLAVAIVPMYLDKNSLVKPKHDYIDSANGVLFSSIFQTLTGQPYGKGAISKCFKEPGLLMRTPTNDGGIEQFDDYLGIAIASIVTRDTANPRSILRYGVKHLGYFNNTDNFTLQAWLGRFPFVWCFMLAAAFPFLKRMLQPFLMLYVRSFKPTNIADTSAIQLQYIQCVGYDTLFGTEEVLRYKNKLVTAGTTLVKAFATYYEPDHPFVTFLSSN